MSSSFKRRGKKATVRPVRSIAPATSSPDESTGSSSSSSSSFSSIKDARQPLATPRSRPTTTTTTTTTSAAAASNILPGTRPWTNNLTLTSFGLREVDSFFFSSSGGNDSSGGGGQPLQTMAMLEEDRLSDDLGRALSRYWCAEGVAQGQLVVMGGMLPGGERLLELLDGADDDDDGVVGISGGHGGGNYEGSTPEELRDFVSSLPRNLHLDKFREKAKKKLRNQSANENNNDNGTLNNREAISAIIEEDEEEEDENDNDHEAESNNNNNNDQSNNNKDEGLINAWQYRKSVQDARSGVMTTDQQQQRAGQSGSGASGGDGIYCHSYDLSKRMRDQFDGDDDDEAADEEIGNNPLLANTKIVDCSHALMSNSGTKNGHRQQGLALFGSLWKHLQSALSNHPNRVIRLFLQRLPVGPGAIAMPLLMAKIRKDNLPVVVLATIRPWRYLSSPSNGNNNNNNTNANNNANKLDTLASLRSSADTALSLDSFSSLSSPPPPEFQLLQGILTVRKSASFTSGYYTDCVAFKQRPLAERYGLKRDGRKVVVQLLHLPPEDYGRGGGGGGVRGGSGGGDNAGDASGGGSRGKKKAGGCSSVGGGASLDF